jgi:hypothetical protein
VLVIGRLLIRFLSPRTRRVLAEVLLDISVVGWPVSLLLTNEPPIILSLSWLELSLTALDILFTSDVTP